MSADEDKILTKWLNGELSYEELEQELGPEAAKYHQITSEIDHWQLPEVKLDPGSITQESDNHETTVRSLNWWVPLSAAASLLLIGVLGFLFFVKSDTTRYTADAGSVLEIDLPDGSSKVTLSAGSSISWTEDQWQDGRRQMKLEGTGYFEVNTGGEFMVFTSAGNVKVLGTKFQVKESKEMMLVKCYEGKVQAEANGASTILTEGIGSIFNGDVWESAKPNNETSPSWLQNRSTFDDVPLDLVIETLEAEYDIEIRTGNVNLKRRFTGSFPNDNLTLALRIVFDPLEISYALKEKVLTLSE